MVEHLDEELGQWSELEYLAIARETGHLCLSSLPAALAQALPPALRDTPGFVAETRGVEELHGRDPARKARVCLLDPAAQAELAPEDGARFDVFLFGGILGDDPPRGKRRDGCGVFCRLSCQSCRADRQTAHRSSARRALRDGASARTR